MNMRLDELKSETFSSLGMKLSAISSNQPSYYYDQPSADLIILPLINPSEIYSHASQFNKHLSCMTLEGDTLLKIQKWWDSILSAF